MAWIKASLKRNSSGSQQVYSFDPAWSISGTGWNATTWPAWSVGRNNGTKYIGIATLAISDTKNYRYLRITPDSLGWSYQSNAGDLRIYVNNNFVWGNQTREAGNPLDLDISAYGSSITIKIELEATWGYATMYSIETLLLHNGI